MTAMQNEKVTSVRKLRLEKGWSQEHLAQLSGLSVRTIQRIEGGGKAGLESLNCLAAAFDVDVAGLVQGDTVNGEETATADTEDSAQSELSREEREEIDYVDNLKGFHLNWIFFVVIMPCLYLLNIFVTPDEGLWVIYAGVAWLFGIALHAVVIFGLFGVFNTKWEQRQIEKRRNRQA